MRNTTLAMMSLCLLVGCSKKDEVNPARYAGRYQGDIEVNVNGTYERTIPAHTLTIHPATVGDFVISDNVIILSSGPVSDDLLILPRTRVASGTSLNVYEYGTGSFRADTLQIEFHQDEEIPSSNTVRQATVYTGKLVRVR
jgi:hypothetical protein